MHEFGGANDGVDRTRLNTKGAADTGGLVDPGDSFRGFATVFRIERFRFAPQQIRECDNRTFAARRALIDIRFIIGNRRRIRFTAGIATLSALGLRQKRIDLVYQRITLHFIAHRCIAKDDAKHHTENR